MKMNRIIAAAAAVLTAVSASAATSFAAADQGLTQAQIDASPVKPVLTTTKIVVDEKNAAGKSVTVTVDVSGASKLYSMTGVYLYYDERLTMGGSITVGTAWSSLWTSFKTKNLVDRPGMKALYFGSTSDGNDGLDGTMVKIQLSLPSDAKPGDVYGLDIAYVDNSANTCMFTNSAHRADITAYTFTQGIYNETYNNNFKASAEDIAKCPALANINKAYDGYIAVSGSSAQKDTLGDVTGDGNVDSSDASAVLAEYARTSTGMSGTFTSTMRTNADVNKDGAINSSDASKILEFYSYVSTGGKNNGMTAYLKG